MCGDQLGGGAWAGGEREAQNEAPGILRGSGLLWARLVRVTPNRTAEPWGQPHLGSVLPPCDPGRVQS